MAGKRMSGSKSGLIHCENCGEYYSDTYRRCPFCDEYQDEYDDYEYEDERPAARGGKRLTQSSRRGGGYTRTSPLKVISMIISLAVIVAAAWVVITKIMPLVQRGDVGTVDPDNSITENVSPDPNASPALTDPGPDVNDSAVDPPDVSPVPDDAVPVPDSGGATGFSLSKSDFSFNDSWPDPITLEVTFTPAGSSGVITWTSSDPDIASVDENGTVSHGTKTGSATITATLSNGVTQTCIARNQLTSPAASVSSGNAGTSSGTYTVNKPDFTFYSAGEQCKLKVNGYSGGVTWSSSNTSIATVSSDGTVTAAGAGKGKCTITGTLDNGSTVQAIARIEIS